jgi:flagellar biogenesis protein FliO
MRAMAAALFCGAHNAWALAAEASGVATNVLGVATNSVVAGSPVVSTGSILEPLIKMIGALAVVFAALFFGVWLFKNWQTVLNRRGVSPKLRVLEVKSLGARQALYVVGYERQRFLIASSSAGLALLTA